MSLNASFPLLNPSKNDQASIKDAEAIMKNVSMVLYALTVLLGIPGNSMVIWVVRFKLKVDSKSIASYKCIKMKYFPVNKNYKLTFNMSVSL